MSSLYQRVLNDFTYHPPKPAGDERVGQEYRYDQIREAGKNLAMLFVGQCPESRELSLALTNIEQAVMWANAAIARNEK
jgi:hypothetical protein